MKAKVVDPKVFDDLNTWYEVAILELSATLKREVKPITAEKMLGISKDHARYALSKIQQSKNFSSQLTGV